MKEPSRLPFRVVFLNDKRFGRGEGRYASVRVRIKRCDGTSPYCVPNELICGEIGRMLRLPIPPFAAMRTPAPGAPYAFGSVEFRERQPGIQPEKCYAKWPILCTGVLLFDILIANEDRHDRNLGCHPFDAPRWMAVYDHDVALFGCEKDRGAERLERLREQLAVTGGTITGGCRHCFLDVLNTAEHFRRWIHRIEMIPRWFLRAVCREAIGLGISRKQAEQAEEFLVHRRDRLADLIKSHRSEFTAISDWEAL